MFGLLRQHTRAILEKNLKYEKHIFVVVFSKFRVFNLPVNPVTLLYETEIVLYSLDYLS